MSKAPPPLLGFNNNVRHRGRVFHIQTEDSGVRTPRIVTHLFADGGRIVKTTRTDYSVHVGTADMATVVRSLMKEQHKAMFAALRAGELDALLEQVCGPLDDAGPEPSSVKLGAPVPKVVVQGSRPEAARSDAEPPPAEATGRQRTLSNPNLRKPVPSVAPPAQSFDLDVALEKLPPKTSRSAESSPRPAAAATAAEPAPAPAPRKSRPSTPPKPKAKPPPLPARRPSAPRNGMPPPPPTPPRNSLFGDDVISEKSLDEVILSYLAEDLEGSQGD